MKCKGARGSIFLLAAVAISLSTAATASDDDEYLDEEATTQTAWSSPASVGIGDQAVKVHFGSRQIYVMGGKTAAISSGSSAQRYSASASSVGKVLVFAGDQPILENRCMRIGKETTSVYFSSTNRKVMTIDDRGGFQVMGAGVAIVTVAIAQQTVCIPFQVTELPVKEGMSPDEVITVLGPPDKRTNTLIEPSGQGRLDGEIYHSGTAPLTVGHWQYKKYPGVILQFRGSDRLTGCFQTEWNQHSLLECKVKN